MRTHTHTPLNKHSIPPSPPLASIYTIGYPFSNIVYTWEVNMHVYVDTQSSLTRLPARYAWNECLGLNSGYSRPIVRTGRHPTSPPRLQREKSINKSSQVWQHEYHKKASVVLKWIYSHRSVRCSYNNNTGILCEYTLYGTIVTFDTFTFKTLSYANGIYLLKSKFFPYPSAALLDPGWYMRVQKQGEPLHQALYFASLSFAD